MVQIYLLPPSALLLASSFATGLSSLTVTLNFVIALYGHITIGLRKCTRICWLAGLIKTRRGITQTRKCPLVFKNIIAYNNQFGPTMFFYEISWIHAISPRDCFEHAILSQPLYHIKYMNQGIKHHKQNHNTYHFVYKVFSVINILLYLNEYNFLPWKMCVCHS